VPFGGSVRGDVVAFAAVICIRLVHAGVCVGGIEIVLIAADVVASVVINAGVFIGRVVNAAERIIG
jgi:hypothetical protein